MTDEEIKQRLMCFDGVYRQVARICQSPQFVTREKLQNYLRYAVLCAVDNRPDDAREITIGQHFYGTRFDPAHPTTGGLVRVQMRQVRLRLRAYYEIHGPGDPIRIVLNKGSFLPVIADAQPIPSILELPDDAKRHVFRAMTALDARQTATDLVNRYLLPVIDAYADHPRVIAICSFLTLAPRHVQAMTLERYAITEFFLNLIPPNTPPSWEYLFVRGCIAAGRDHAWAAAKEFFDGAIKLSNGEALYYWWPTALMVAMGQLPEAIRLLQDAVAHFARSHIDARLDLAVLLIMAGRFSEAEEMLQDTQALSPQDTSIPLYFALLYEAQDRVEDAHRVSSAWLHPSGRFSERPDSLLLFGMPLFIAGRAGDFDTPKREYSIYRCVKLDWTLSSHMPNVGIALAAMGAGRHEEAVKWLEYAAYQEHEYLAMWYHVFPPFRHLKDRKDFKRLLQRLKLKAAG